MSKFTMVSQFDIHLLAFDVKQENISGSDIHMPYLITVQYLKTLNYLLCYIYHLRDWYHFTVTFILLNQSE